MVLLTLYNITISTKNTTIAIRVTDAQRQMYEEAAEKERVPLPVWIRKHLDIVAEEQLKKK